MTIQAQAADWRVEQKLELLGKQMFMLFPTVMFTGLISDITACDRIEVTLREMQKAKQGGQAKSRELAFMTHDNLQTLPNMKELVNLVMKESGQIMDAYKIKRESHYITNMWANIANPNRPHAMHVHPNCLFSGILYIKTPKDCGPTMFTSPRQLSRMFEPAYSEKNELNSDVFIMPAEKGRMLIWPSYLPHAVEQGKTANEDDERIVVAFNIMIRGKIDGLTMSLELK